MLVPHYIVLSNIHLSYSLNLFEGLANYSCGWCVKDIYQRYLRRSNKKDTNLWDR